jgi:uncharacterized membrane protein
VSAPGQPPSIYERAVSHLRALEEMVLSILEHQRPHRDVNRLHQESMTFGQRVADRVAATMGSWRFIIVQSALLAVWIALNLYELIWRAWDPCPFILLNLMLSFQAAYSGPIIMMSQNRQAAKDRLQAEMDLRTDVKAELLIEELHGHVEELRLDKWDNLLAIQQRQIELLQQLVSKLETEGRGA